jgi:hypothetical protein
MTKTLIPALFLAACLVACGDSSPGPLAGTWQAGGVLPMKVTFRSGETETMGLIEKVGYTVQSQSVLVNYKDGPMKGTSVRFEFVGKGTARAMGVTYRKVGG